MGLIASDKGSGDYELTEEGVHLAVCYGVIDLGQQHNPKFDNWPHKIMIQWELPNLRIDIKDGERVVSKPRAISRRFTLSLSDKSHLRPFLESWRGKKFTFEELAGFDIQNVVGVNCMLQILHEKVGEKTYANVHTVMPIAKGTDKLVSENPVMFYSMEDQGLDFPKSIPEWIQGIIMKSKEWNETGQQNDEPTYPEDHGSEEPPMHGDEDLSSVPF